ncbi:STAS domain-containing protein [Ruania albidiflava]|uniref:STAS domain-containing protein n=1 Tax=Ruania albidiflava TaxID=366586 RepID=UPI0003B6C174|nr:STAS domain-containing protein [Ruania albidiflava]
MIDVVTSTGGLLVTITGDLDLARRDEADAALRRIALRERPNLTVDLCGMTFMDSTGAAWLTALVEHDRGLGGRPVLRGAGPRDLFVLEVCGLLDRVEVDTTHRCSRGHRVHATA